jgi:hypothetical protein
VVKIMTATMRMTDWALHDQIKAEIGKEDDAKAAADNSWGFGSRRVP